MILARKGAAFRRPTGIVLTILLVSSMIGLGGAGVVGATWAPAYVERYPTADPNVPPMPDSGQSRPDISSDGSVVVFESGADNLTTNHDEDDDNIFSCDVATGVSTLISVSSSGEPGNDDSDDPSVSSDGRYVAFESEAGNLVAGDTNGNEDIFVRDTKFGTTERVSIASDGGQSDNSSSDPAISDDGKRIAFSSYGTTLVAGDTNGSEDVFVRDMVSGETTLVSQSSTGVRGDSSSDSPAISADGRYVVFDSGSSLLVPGDTNNEHDIFRHDLVSGETTLVSQSTTGEQGDDDSYDPVISGDGRYVAWRSNAEDLVPDDDNNDYDIFVRDMNTGVTTRVSVQPNGDEDYGNCEYPAISDDGRYIGFRSTMDELVSGDDNGEWDAFVHDMTAGTTALVSRSSEGDLGNRETYRIALDATGSRVAFDSYAMNLVESDWNQQRDIFIREMPTGPTTLLCSGAFAYEYPVSDAEFGRLSADGRYVVFHSRAGNIVPGDSNGDNDVFLIDRETGDIELVSVNSAGEQADNCSSKPTISADGRYVVFQSDAENLAMDDGNGRADIFLRDRWRRTTVRVSTRAWDMAPWDEDDECASWPQINADGTHIVFRSAADDLVVGDTNGLQDIFAYEIESGQTERITLAYDGGEAYGRDGGGDDGSAHWPTLSGDGSYAAFRSNLTSLTLNPVEPCGGGHMAPQIYVRDLVSDTTTLASVSATGSTGNSASRWPSMSYDGRYVAFQSGASNLVPNDTNSNEWGHGGSDVFVRDLVSGETTRVSIASDGTEANGCSSNPCISGNGRYVTFKSWADNLVPGDTNDKDDIFVHDMQTGETLRVSVAIDGTQADKCADKPWISHDGSFIAFQSNATNLVKGDPKTQWDECPDDSIHVVSMWDIPEVDGVDRMSGSDRFATAIAASEANFSSADTVVLATGLDFPDALSASGLAGAFQAPLLLTRTDSLCDGLAAELERLGTEDIFIVGGTGVVSAGVQATLTSMGYEVERIGGTNRYQTAALVADEIADELGGDFPADVFIARGDTFPDALAVAPFAYNQGMPILLTPSDALSAETSGALADLAIEDAVLVGGEGAVSAAVAADVAGIVSGTTSREAGTNRYATAVAIAERGITEGWGGAWFVGLTTGETYPDAFSGGSSCGFNGGVLLLTRPTDLPASVAAFLAAHADEVIECQVYGGANSVDPMVAQQIAEILP